MKKIVLSICLCFIINIFYAQGLKFVETTHEFYHIQEVGGKVNCQFLFANLSSSDINISNVSSAACPCLSFEWKQTSIKPNDKGTVTVYMDPLNRKGMFAYPIQVTTLENGKSVNYELMVKGYIVPKPQTKQEEYGMKEGNLRYKTNQKRYIMHREQVVYDTINFYNEWDSVMTFTYSSLPPSIKISYLTPSLEPKGEGILAFSFSAKVKNDWGNVWDRMEMFTNDPDRPKKTFYITAEVYDDFSVWTPEQRANAPHIYYDTDEFNFGTDTSGKDIRCTFTIKNTGKSNLLIHKVKTSCGCTTPTLIKTELVPNESVPVDALFRTGGKTGSQYRTIDIITNDPDQPKVTLKIRGTLIEVPKK